jgi:cytochrome c556
MKPRLKSAAAAAAALSLLAACTPSEAPQPSIQDIMATIVDPSADALWDAVSTEVTALGVEEKRPRGDAEWRSLRARAATLAEGARLLAARERPVTHGARQVEDAHVAGVLAAHEVEKAIGADRPGFEARARDLQQAAGEALAAIDARNADRLLVVGGQIDQACERCHQSFWYPAAEGPKAKWPAPLKAAGLP